MKDCSEHKEMGKNCQSTMDEEERPPAAAFERKSSRTRNSLLTSKNDNSNSN